MKAKYLKYISSNIIEGQLSFKINEIVLELLFTEEISSLYNYL